MCAPCIDPPARTDESASGFGIVRGALDESEPQTGECGQTTTAAVSVTLRVGAQVFEPMSGVLEGDAAQATLSFATDPAAAGEGLLAVASGQAILGDGLRALHVRLLDGDVITLNSAAIEAALGAATGADGRR